MTARRKTTRTTRPDQKTAVDHWCRSTANGPEDHTPPIRGVWFWSWCSWSQATEQKNQILGLLVGELLATVGAWPLAFPENRGSFFLRLNLMSARECKLIRISLFEVGERAPTYPSARSNGAWSPQIARLPLARPKQPRSNETR